MTISHDSRSEARRAALVKCAQSIVNGGGPALGSALGSSPQVVQHDGGREINPSAVSVQDAFGRAAAWNRLWAASPATQRIFRQNRELSGVDDTLERQMSRLAPEKWRSVHSDLAALNGAQAAWYPGRDLGAVYDWTTPGSGPVGASMRSVMRNRLLQRPGLATHETTHQVTTPDNSGINGRELQQGFADAQAKTAPWFLRPFARKAGRQAYRDTYYTPDGAPRNPREFYPQAAQISSLLARRGIPHNRPADYGNAEANPSRDAAAAYSIHPFEAHAELNRLRYETGISPDKRNWTSREVRDMLERYRKSNPNGFNMLPEQLRGGDLTLLRDMLNTVARTDGTRRRTGLQIV